MTDMQAIRESSFIDGKVEGRVEGKTEGHHDALAVAQDMKLPPELIAEFKARLEAKSAQK